MEENRNVKKKKYYSLLEEYKQITEQMKFNQNFYDRDKLNKIAKELEIKISAIIKRIKRTRISIVLQNEMNYHELLELNHLKREEQRLNALLIKIQNREYIENEDYENTYHTIRTYIFHCVPVSLVFSLMILILVIYELVKSF